MGRQCRRPPEHLPPCPRPPLRRPRARIPSRLRRPHDRPRLRFQRPHWDFPESPVQGLYHRQVVYESVRSLDDFRPWLDQIVHFPEEVIDQAWKRIPPDWIDGEEDQLAQLRDRLHARRSRLPELISACRESRINPFPNWAGSTTR